MHKRRLHSRFARLAQMDTRELSWRSHAALRAGAQRAATSVRPPRWNRRALVSALATDPPLAAIRRAAKAAAWRDVHDALSRHLLDRPSTFVIAPAERARVSHRIQGAFPSAAADAAARADAIVRGQYDLLGYRGLTFQSQPPDDLPDPPDARDPRDSRDLRALPDWHYDPVHDRHAPRLFWSSVPFLDPSCGDHKIIWELNRHQHWLTLGRAYWLTGSAEYRERALGELHSWLASNPPLVGINWASMLELGFRSLSWIWALHFFVSPDPERDAAPWTVDLLVALDRQLTHVEQNLSYYFSPNTHLLGEALALYVSGLALPELAASPRRAATGRRILVAEIARQIAADGGHCERSSHYHRYALDFYAMALTVARVAQDPIAAVFERALLRLATAARLLCDDRGQAPHLGDDDGGALLRMTGRPVDDWSDSLAIAALLTGRDDLRVAPPPEEAVWMLSHSAHGDLLDSRSRRLSSGGDTDPWRSAALAETGYYISRSAAGEHLVIDGGPHGYQNAGHAHADALALTLSIRGLPLLIDPGTACYTVDPVTRDRFRSTALHNTLTLDGQPQSLPAAPFHWAQTTNAAVHRWRTTHAFDYFDGSHQGYAPATHRRRVLALHSDLVVVADHVDDPTRTARAASVHWHVDPAWTIDTADRIVALRSKHERAALVAPIGQIESFAADPVSGLGWHAPEYGRIERAATIAIRHESPAPFWIVSVFDLNPTDPVEEVTFMPVWAEAGTVTHATALRIARRRSIDFALFAEPSKPQNRATWRVAEFETDARMLLCSVSAAGNLTRLALVDGSLVRGTGKRAVGIGLGHLAPSLYIDESSLRKYTPCAASPAL